MRLKFAHVHFIIAWSLFIEVTSNNNGDYKVGVGISDVTGPAAEVGMVKNITVININVIYKKHTM